MSSPLMSSATEQADETAEKTWDRRILEKIPSGVDVTLIDESLRLTPTERVERMRRVLESLEEVRKPHDD